MEPWSYVSHVSEAPAKSDLRALWQPAGQPQLDELLQTLGNPGGSLLKLLAVLVDFGQTLKAACHVLRSR